MAYKTYKLGRKYYKPMAESTHKNYPKKAEAMPDDNEILMRLDTAFWITDTAGRLVYWNDKFRQILKDYFDIEIYSGLDLISLFTGNEHLTLLRRNLESLLEGKNKSYSTIKGFRYNEQNLYFRLDFHSFCLQADSCGIAGTASEVDESVFYERSLYDQGPLFRDLTDNLGIAVFAFDSGFEFFYANKAVLNLTGYTLEEFSNKNFLILFIRIFVRQR